MKVMQAIRQPSNNVPLFKQMLATTDGRRFSVWSWADGLATVYYKPNRKVPWKHLCNGYYNTYVNGKETVALTSKRGNLTVEYDVATTQLGLGRLSVWFLIDFAARIFPVKATP